MAEPQPEPTQPEPFSVPPYHDPWAATEQVPGPASTLPAPPPQPAAPVSDPGYPPPTRYPYPGLMASYPAPANYPAPASYQTPVGYPLDEPVIMQIGDIQVTANTVRTPAGTFPLQGSQWTVTDQWVSEQKIPTWAIILAVALFFCVAFFSLLFLLAKETVHRAVVQVHVVSGPHQYVARIPVNDQSQVQYLYQQVNYVRSLATM
jgi:hypothetical protein